MTTIVNMVNQYAEKIYNQSESSTVVKVQSEQTTIAAIQSESSFNKKVQSKIFYFDQNYSSSSDTFGLGISYELIVLL